MTKKPKPVTLEDKIQYQTTNRIDLDTGNLSATPDDPGGCQTLGYIHMKGAVLLGRDFYDELIRTARAHEGLLKDNLALLAGLRGKHATVGATYTLLAVEADRMRTELATAQDRVKVLEDAIKPVLRQALDDTKDYVKARDRDDDEVLAASLLGPYAKLYEAMKYDH